MRERLEAAALLIGRPYELSRRRPPSWRRAASIGADIALDGKLLEQALVDAAAAGLIDRREDETWAGDQLGVGLHRASVSLPDLGDGARDAALDRRSGIAHQPTPPPFDCSQVGVGSAAG